MSEELHGDIEAQVANNSQERRHASPWSFSVAGIFARLAEVAEASGSRADRRERERSLEASTSGREEQQVPQAVTLSASAPASLSGRSLGGLLRQLSGRQEPEGRADGVETTAAAAERHRLTGGSSNLDFQALTQWLEKNAPFITILLIVFVSQHILGLSVISFITAILATGNSFIRKQMALKEGRRVVRILLMMCLLCLVVPLLLLLPHRCLTWRAVVLLLPPKIDSVWDCLFCITIADGVLRIITMVAKLGVVAFGRSPSDDPLRRRSQLLTLTEHFSLLYRALIPTPLWFMYLYRSRNILFSCITGAFLATKCQFVYERANNVANSVRSVWRQDSQYGKYLSLEDLAETGTSCPICQESMTRPFQLTQCRHAFCDACLTEWLERQCTCPMCRAIVRPPGMQAFGSGTVSLLPQLF